MTINSTSINSAFQKKHPTNFSQILLLGIQMKCIYFLHKQHAKLSRVTHINQISNAIKFYVSSILIFHCPKLKVIWIKHIGNGKACLYFRALYNSANKTFYIYIFKEMNIETNTLIKKFINEFIYLKKSMANLLP